MDYRRLLLLPFALLFGLIIRVRNWMYDAGLLRSMSYPLPLICVGNLVTGGTGKTPHIEYLIRLLSGKYRVATLSRGYGRRTRGFRLAAEDDDHWAIGDEPLQYSRKFRELIVCVDESRNDGVRKLMSLEEPPEVVLLDDGYQHRSIRPGLNILLTDFHDLYTKDLMLPAGKLREPVSGAARADAIIVTKTPEVFSPITRRMLTEELRLKPGQQLFFSYLEYDRMVPLTPAAEKEELGEINTIFLLAGIANPYPLEDHLRRKYGDVVTLQFPDHYVYTEKDLEGVRRTYLDHLVRRKLLVTTEKDAMRLGSSNLLSLLEDIPLVYIPVRVHFHDGDGAAFEKLVLDYVHNHTTNR